MELRCTKVFCLFLKQKLGNEATQLTVIRISQVSYLLYLWAGSKLLPDWLQQLEGNQRGERVVGEWGYLVWDEAIVVWVWGYSGMGMRLQQSGNETTVVWEWDCSGVGMRLQQSGNEATAYLVQFCCHGILEVQRVDLFFRIGLS